MTNYIQQTNIKQLTQLNDIIVALKNDMEVHGLPCPDEIKFNTSVPQRYSIKQPNNQGSEWYWATCKEYNGKPYVICTYSSWNTGLAQQKYVFKSYEMFNEFGPCEFQQIKKDIEQQEAAAERYVRQERDQAAIKAQDIWQKAVAQPPSDGYIKYLNIKGVEPVGARFDMVQHEAKYLPATIINIQNIDGQIRSLQYLFMDETNKPKKKLLYKGEKHGNFHIIGSITNGCVLYVVEGYATGLSVYQATGETIIVAIDAGNLSSVTEQLKNKYDACKIIIAGDDDDKGNNTPNAGVESARKAAERIGCCAIFPKFPAEDSCRPIYGNSRSDFNDLHQACGIDEVKKQLFSGPSFFAVNDIHAANVDLNGSNEEALRLLADNLLKEEQPCDAFSLDAIPQKLRDHVLELCSTNSANTLAVLGSLLTSASAAVGRRHYIEKATEESEGYFSRLYANLWIVCIAPSGQYKSSALNAGARYAQEHRLSINETLKSLKKQIKNTDNESQVLELEERLATIEKSIIMFPDRITPEALLQYLGQGRSGAMFHGEFGGFIKELTKPSNVGLMAMLTKFYDVEPISEDATKTQGCNFIERPYISIYGVTTLSWLGDSFQNKDVRGGFWARFLVYSLPPLKERPLALPMKKYSTKENTYEPFKKILDGLDAEERRYRLTAEAVIFYKDVFNKIWDIKDAFDSDASYILDPYIGRWPATILKVAMLMQLFIDPTTNFISEEAIHAAVAFVYPAIRSTIKIFKDDNSLGITKFEENCNRIFTWICSQTKSHGVPPTHAKLNSSKAARVLRPKERDEILRALEEAGRIKINTSNTKNETTYEILKQK